MFDRNWEKLVVPLHHDSCHGWWCRESSAVYAADGDMSSNQNPPTRDRNRCIDMDKSNNSDPKGPN